MQQIDDTREVGAQWSGDNVLGFPFMHSHGFLLSGHIMCTRPTDR